MCTQVKLYRHQTATVWHTGRRATAEGIEQGILIRDPPSMRGSDELDGVAAPYRPSFDPDWLHANQQSSGRAYRWLTHHLGARFLIRGACIRMLRDWKRWTVQDSRGIGSIFKCHVTAVTA